MKPKRGNRSRACHGGVATAAFATHAHYTAGLRSSGLRVIEK